MQQDSLIEEKKQGGDAGGKQSQEKQGWLTRQLGDLRSWKKSMEAHPLKGAILAVVLFALGVVGSVIIDRIKSKVLGPDEFLVQIADSQKQEFAALRKNLDHLSSSIDSGDRQAFDSVRNAVKTLEGSNNQLMQQLVLAKRENDTLRKTVEQKTGVSGGYDFILAEDNGIRLDNTTILGVQGINSGYVRVSLTSSDADKPANQSLQSGQSLTYRSATGKSCKVSVLSINNGNPGTASFAVGCT